MGKRHKEDFSPALEVVQVKWNYDSDFVSSPDHTHNTHNIENLDSSSKQEPIGPIYHKRSAIWKKITSVEEDKKFIHELTSLSGSGINSSCCHFSKEFLKIRALKGKIKMKGQLLKQLNRMRRESGDLETPDSFQMNNNLVDKITGNENDVLFGIPDTGVSVSWDFSAGCAANEKKGTHLKPVTPKATKFSSSSSRIYRRRCLANQIKLPTDGDDAFAEQMLSLVSVNRKSIIKNSPGVSPKGRSPRTPRPKMSKPSPIRDDNFLFLLNDSIENDAMIRCSQITEATLKMEDKKSPVVAKKEGRVSSAKRLSSRNVGSPYSRKRLLDAISSCSKVSPLRESNNVPAKVEPEVEKSSADCNNKVETVFGTSDDDLLVNFFDDFSLPRSELPRKSPRLSLRRTPGVSGVTPLARVDSKIAEEAISTDPWKANDPIVESEHLDDGLDFFELSPHLLELLDGHVVDSKCQQPKEVPSCRTNVTTVQLGTSNPTKRCTKLEGTSEPFKNLVANQAPPTATQISVTSSSLPKGPLSLSLSQADQRNVENSLVPPKGLTRHASAPGLGRSSHVQPALKPSLPPSRNKAPFKKCTPDEIERKRQEALRKLKKSQSK